MNIQITMSGNAGKFLADYPGAIMRAIARGQDIATQEATAKIIPERLTGKGPFPVEEHRLGRVTHFLATTTRPSAAVIAGNTVTTGIGSDAPYFFAHEYGFVGRVAVRRHSRSAGNRDIRQRGPRGGRGKLLASGVAFIANHTRMMNLPARAPVQTGIAENAEAFVGRIREQLLLEWRAS